MIMTKADHKFYRDKRQDIEDNAKQNETNWGWQKSNPIFIPKRKKKK
jgi:hypothetical protein